MLHLSLLMFPCPSWHSSSLLKWLKMNCNEKSDGKVRMLHSVPPLHPLPQCPPLSLKVQWQWGEDNKLLHSLPYTPLSHPKLLSLFMMIILFFCHHQRWKLRWIRRKSNKEMLHPFPVLHPSYFMKNKTWEVAIDKRSSTLPMLWWEVTIDNKNRSSTFPMLLCQFFPYHLPNAPP